MSKYTLQTKLDQINLKIQQAREEREAFLSEYFEAIKQKLIMIEAHVLPLEVLVGAVLDAMQKYTAKDGVIKKWEGMAHPFFRTKRPAKSQPSASKHNGKLNPDDPAKVNETQNETERPND